MSKSLHANIFSVVLFATLLVLLPPAISQAAKTINFPADPPAKRTEALETVWRLGGDDEDILLGLITSGILDDEGYVLLADQQLSHVLVVSPEGEVVATLGREGDGPGELRNLLSIIRDGDRVGMVQGFPGKVVYVDREGVPVGGFTLGDEEEEGGHFAIRELRTNGTVLVGHTDRTSINFDEDEAVTRSTLSVLDFDGAFGAELASQEVSRGIMTIVLDEAAEWAEFATWAVSSGGVVATVAERDTWAVNERSLDGELKRVLRRPSKGCNRTEEEKEAAAARIPVAVATGRSKMEKKPLATDPAIVALDYATDGRLFVTACHHATGELGVDVAGRFDVISPEGEFLEELTLTYSDFDPEQDVLIFLDGASFLILCNYEDAQKAIRAAFLPEEEREDLSDAEPLEVIFARMPD